MAIGYGNSYLPFLAMVFVQACYAGMNITSKLALEAEMSPLVLVAYRQVFATLAIAPFAYWMEWKTRPQITMPILFQIFLCSLTGATANQVLYFVGLNKSSATVACALTNTLPAMTFILAVLFRQESAKMKSKAGLAKVMGTAVCVCGAMILSFYHGKNIGIGESKIHWSYAQKMGESSSGNNANSFVGPILVLVSTLGWAMWFIIQAKVSDSFPAPYTSTTLMCLMASLECGLIAVSVEHNAQAWALTNPMKLTAGLYSGIMGSAVAFFFTSWCIQRKGPLYVSVFSPLLLIIVAVSSWALLDEKLYLGTALGSILIVAGLYSVLWGKTRETAKLEGKETDADTKLDAVFKEFEKNDLELQLHK
ncbi:PREDICTED: WAT1-related protein At1g09380 [Fragaria vesca subsp. vesca]|uniref:WAT1-related protein At1g09380 n=1 Tax=Fragaria vesca subsp. vesca TaxID=101020 RepID=UPI0002C32654|nr:PREDICTED: WAT1-related protein At1g09380 [Fragaria vesca subsp. vesca]